MQIRKSELPEPVKHLHPTSDNIADQRFGMLKVLYPTKERYRGNVYWVCKCDCGNYTLATCADLRRGNTTSCGCKLYNDLTGKKFGHLTVVRDTGKTKRNSRVWECKCDCGNIVEKITTQLKENTYLSCGCVFRGDLTGRKFGNLTVVKDTGRRDRSNARIWECRCKCGNTVEVPARYLTTGTKTSCGCDSKRKSFIGERFGHLTVESEAPASPKTTSRMWTCKCDCGKTCVKSTHYLKSKKWTPQCPDCAETSRRANRRVIRCDKEEAIVDATKE